MTALSAQLSPRRLLALALLLLTGCGGGTRLETSLLARLPGARVEPLVVGSGTLGSCTYRPFLGKGMHPDANNEWVTPFAGVTEAGFGFYLHDVTPVKVTLEGRHTTRGFDRPLTFLINGKEIASETIGPNTDKHTFKPEVGVLKVGMNWVTVRDCQATQWLTMAVAADRARTLGDSPARAKWEGQGQEEALYLPFDQRVEIALGESSETGLVLHAEPWVEPGAPSIDGWQVGISLATEGQAYAELASLGAGDSETPLAPSTGPRALALKAHPGPGQQPLPGQLGVKLTRPRLICSVAPTPSATPPAPAPLASPSSPPNVVVYLVDTLRADRLGVYGCSKPTSPRLDQMAKESVVFEQALSTAPWTKPAVASLFTGTEPVDHGVLDFIDKLPPDLVTMAEVFQGARYKTAAFVTNPLVGRQFDFNQGFATFEDVPYAGVNALKVNQRVIPWLDTVKKDQPFFLYVHTLDPHIPYYPPEPFRRAWVRNWKKPPPGDHSKAVLGNLEFPRFLPLADELKRRSFEVDPYPIPQATYDNLNALYEGELATSDAGFGALLDALKKKGVYDDTMIVFLSDHGEEILDRQKLGHLHKVYQELMRIPLVVKYPKNRHGGTRVDQPCQVVDLMPTVLAEAGLPIPPEVSWHRLPLETSQEVRPFFCDIEAGRQAVLASQPGGNYLIDATGVRLGRWTAALCRAGNFPTDPFTLYDLQADPGETRNLWLEQPVRALYLESLIRGYQARRMKGNASQAASTTEAEGILRSLQYLR